MVAQFVAKYGRQLSAEENLARLYYEGFDQLEASMKGKKIFTTPVWKHEIDGVSASEIKKYKNNLKNQRERICDAFIDAVNRHDGETIINIAKAVWFFKDKRYPHFILADRERAYLLMLKAIQDITGEKIFTIQTIATMLMLDELRDGKKFQVPADGFSALRRKCREINLELAPERKISKK